MNKSYNFQFVYIRLAIDITVLTDGCGLSNEARHELLSKKSKVILYLLFVSQCKPFNLLYFINKMEHFNFGSGRAVQVMKLIKED